MVCCSYINRFSVLVVVQTSANSLPIVTSAEECQWRGSTGFMFHIVKRRGWYSIVLLLRTTTDGRSTKRRRRTAPVPQEISFEQLGTVDGHRCSVFDSNYCAYFERVRLARGSHCGRRWVVGAKNVSVKVRQPSGRPKQTYFLARPLATAWLGRRTRFCRTGHLQVSLRSRRVSPLQLTQVACALRNILSAVQSVFIFINGTRANIRFYWIILSSLINDVSVTLNTVDVASVGVRSSSSCVLAQFGENFEIASRYV